LVGRQVWPAIISSSFVEMTQIDTALSDEEMHGSLAALACTPSHASSQHKAAGTGAECSPMQAVETKIELPSTAV